MLLFIEIIYQAWQDGVSCTEQSLYSRDGTIWINWIFQNDSNFIFHAILFLHFYCIVFKILFLEKVLKFVTSLSLFFPIRNFFS